MPGSLQHDVSCTGGMIPWGCELYRLLVGWNRGHTVAAFAHPHPQLRGFFFNCVQSCAHACPGPVLGDAMPCWQVVPTSPAA